MNLLERLLPRVSDVLKSMAPEMYRVSSVDSAAICRLANLRYIDDS